MKALITGGAGFIGSHLCEYLVQQDWSVVCLDNLLTSDITDIRGLMPHKNFQFIERDVTEPLPLKSKTDYVFHLASPASPLDFQKLPIEIWYEVRMRG